MSQVFIKNVQGVTIRIPVRVGEEGSGAPDKLFDFNREKTDRFTGQLQDNGYTVIEREDYDALYEGSKIFKEKIDSGKLVKFDEAPDDALTAEQLAQKFSAENYELRQKNAELQAQLDGFKPDEGMDALKKALDESKENLAALQSEYNGLQGRFNTLQGDFDKRTIEYEAYKQANPEKKK